LGVYVQNLVTIGSFSKKVQQKDRWTKVCGPETDRRQSLSKEVYGTVPTMTLGSSCCAVIRKLLPSPMAITVATHKTPTAVMEMLLVPHIASPMVTTRLVTSHMTKM